MVAVMEAEMFGSCTNHGECEAACPKEIPLGTIAQMNRDAIMGKPGWSRMMLSLKTCRTRNAGAAPKLMTSARLSSCPPKSVVWRVIRASRPSSASNSIATKMRYAAATKRCWRNQLVIGSVVG